MADQPACGSREPHRPHNGFAAPDNAIQRYPWCWGYGSNAIDPEKDRRRAMVGKFNFGSSTLPGLSKLNEECGELIQVIGKLMSTSGSPDHWADPNLHKRLLEEMADVYAALAFVVQHAAGIDDTAYVARIATKRELFELWHNEVDLPPGMIDAPQA